MERVCTTYSQKLALHIYDIVIKSYNEMEGGGSWKEKKMTFQAKTFNIVRELMKIYNKSVH